MGKWNYVNFKFAAVVFSEVKNTSAKESLDLKNTNTKHHCS
jgi:hypothetical protein